MVEFFPEIQSFFRKKEFSQEELDELKERLIFTYGKEKSILNTINSSINLNLIHYRISGPINETLEKSNAPKLLKTTNQEKAKNKPPRPLKMSKEEKSNRKQRKTEKYLEEFESRLINNFLKYTINKPLVKAAIYVGMEIDDFKNKLMLPKEYNRDDIKVFEEILWVFNKKWIEGELNYNRKNELSGKVQITPEIFYNNVKGKSLEIVAEILGFETSKFIQLCHLSGNQKLPSTFNDELWVKNKKWIKQRLQKLSKENLRDKPSGRINSSRRKRNSQSVPSGVYGKLLTTKTIKSIIYTRM
jgi:hypothetical protein